MNATRDPVARPALDSPALELTTWKGFAFQVRPARPEDRARLAEFFDKVSPEDRRFRFLSAVRKVDDDLLRRMTQVDHERTEDFLAFDGDRLIASAMLASDEDRHRAEVAVSIRSDYKQRGIGWTLLDYVARQAERMGFGLIESVESRDNVEAIELEKEMQFSVTPYPGDATLVLLQKKLGEGQTCARPNVAKS